MSVTRVVLVDDHLVVRRGVESLLSAYPDIQIIATAPSGESLLASLDLWLPDVVVMDINMPGGIDGIETTRRMREQSPHTQVVILTAHADDERVMAGLRAGAIGYIRKEGDPVLLIEAIRAASRGQSLLDPGIATTILQELTQHRRQDTLTEREHEVLMHLAHGRTNKQIAERLVVSEETIKTHVGNVIAKLQLAHRQQAIVYALKRGLISLNDLEI